MDDSGQGPQDAEAAREWETIGDDEQVSVHGEFHVKDTAEFIEAVDELAERAGVEEVTIDLVAIVEAHGTKRSVVDFMDMCGQAQKMSQTDDSQPAC